MMGNYILVNGEPVLEPDVRKWSAWFDRADRKLAHDKCGDSSVSTVFLSTDHNFGSGPPILWETMVFGGTLHQECARYTSKEDAIVGHAAMVKRVYAERRIAMRIWRFFGRITRRFSRKS